MNRFRSAGALLAAACALASVAFLYRAFLASGGDLVAGDLTDARSLIAVLEHWQAVFAGRAPLTSPNFFTPFRGVLGYGEAMSLFAPPFAALKLLGLDPYLAYQLALALVKAAGFCALFALLRRPMSLSRGAALLGAALFTVSNNSYISAPHAQLSAVAFLPVAAWLFWRYLDRGSSAPLAAAALIAGLLLTTSFYLAFFSGLAALFALLAMALPGVGPGPAALGRLAPRLASDRRALAAASLALLAPLALFLYIYLPALAHTGGRTFGESFVYLRNWWEALDLGPDNLLWGGLVRRWYGPRRPMTGEYGHGIAPVTAVTAALALVMLRRRPAVAVIGFTTAALALVTVKYGSLTPWWFVFRFVPGGQGTRVPGRASHLIGLGAAVLCAAAVDACAKRSQSRRRALIPALFAALLLGEQINIAPVASISRRSEQAVLGRFGPPPAPCRAFFAWTAGRPDAAGQVDAMLLARLWNVPTMNGYHGFFPPNWYLVRFDDAYLDQARNYAVQLGLTRGLCEADFTRGLWMPVTPEPGAPYTPGRVVHFGSSGDSSPYQAMGWSYSEPGATWTVSSDATLFFRLPPGAAPAFLHASLAGFIDPAHPATRFRVLVNGVEIGAWRAGSDPPWLDFRASIPPAALSGSLARVVFHIDNPRSPAELGMSPDMRRLGVALRALALEP